jgi:hypothetical protein
MAQKRFKGADNRHAARGRGEAQSGARHEAGSVQPILVDHANFRNSPFSTTWQALEGPSVD